MHIIKSSWTYIILFSFLMFSCLQDSDLEIPDAEKALVLNGIITPDSTITISLSSTRKVASNEEVENVEDADIQLFEDGILIGNLVPKPKTGQEPVYDFGNRCFYTIDYRPLIGRVYKLIAKKEGFKTIETETIIPENKGAIESLELLSDIEFRDKELIISISDNSSEANYYHLTVINKYSVREIIGVDTITVVSEDDYTFYKIKNTSLGEGLDEDNRYGYRIRSDYYGYVLTDELFNNKSIAYNTSVSSVTLGYEEEQYLRNRSLQFELRAVSEGYYKYQRTINLQRASVDNPLAEPVFIYNNVENGFGNFSGYTSVKSERLILE